MCPSRRAAGCSVAPSSVHLFTFACFLRYLYSAVNVLLWHLLMVYLINIGLIFINEIYKCYVDSYVQTKIPVRACGTILNVLTLGVAVVAFSFYPKLKQLFVL
jgi:hypothetical protein